jgi:hypothetical protein
MSAAWQDAFGPVQTSVTCGGAQHTVRWDAGRLLAPDHPDAEGELVMAALGGETSRCLELVEAWGAHADDLDVLALGPRSAADEVTVRMPPEDEDDEQTMLSYGWYGYAPLTRQFHAPGGIAATLRARRRIPALRQLRRRALLRAHLVGSRPMIRPGARSGGFVSTSGIARHGLGGRRGQQEDPAEARAAGLMLLLALGTPVQLRLTAAVAAAWSADAPGRDRAAAGPALTAALTGRLAPVAQAWLGIDPGRVEARLHDGEGWGRFTTSGTGDQRRLTAALPAGWLASVWAPGLALTGGHLVVAVREAAWPRAQVLAVPEPGAEPKVLTVRQEAGRWQVAAD